jgi:DNA-binding MarR family transcriptional regulator
MIAGLSEARRPDESPWEPLGRFRDGRGQFLSSRVVGGVPTMRARYAIQTSKAVDAKSGLTRRGVIYEYVRRCPGSHVRAIARELGLATGDLQYHLSWLERHGFVRTKKNGFYRFVFPTMVFKEEQEALLAVLSQRTPREILLCLLADPSTTQGELASALGYSQPTVSWHMSRLVRLGVLSKRRTRRGVAYEVAASRDEVLSFVKSYHPEVWRRWAGRLGEKNRSLLGARLTPPAVVELVGKR